ncbi:ABC transporter substrate-binding protein [Proteiniborus sp. MB09-C3]|uniref:ABC transporter substrate-binding protein n=1 Tax=Proteiniborus sp. MB09-C3 TaxID=3050072 RepID=UPI002556A238|nr:ABC transporter substrate-binding protein [Proteiniborus sp. MB09-C3]WIV11792.1 ABC transporter substrate-binding protein [Proteiniborus sp. MB09-C3]
MSKKIISLLIVVCLFMSMITACSNNGAEVTPDTEPVNKVSDEPEKKPEDENKTLIFTDSAGREVEVPADITRIAASGSLAQIVIFALAPDMLVGLSGEWGSVAEQYIDKEYYNLPVLGQFYGKGDLNLEEVAKADPQVIIDIGESKSSIAEDMDGIAEQVGIPTVHIEATTESMGKAYRMLGDLLGREKEAEVLAQYCEEIYNNTQEVMKKVGEAGKVNLIYSVGEDGLSVLAKDSFHAEIIDQVSNNVAVVDDISSKGSGNPVDMEQIILWDPEVIIFAPGSYYSGVAEDKAWQELKAIKNNKYFEVPMGPYNWMGTPPSVNRYMGMIWITQLLYPEVAQYNLYEETAKYYKLFYHCELSEDQYNDLIKNSK